MNTSMNKDYFGWNLLLRTVTNKIQSDFDILVCVIHWYMTRKGFSCLGIADDNTVVASELLPDHWNAKRDICKLRYQKDGNLFILTAMKTQGFALFNLLNVKETELTNVLFKIKEIVRGRTGNLPEVINNPPEVLMKINEHLLAPKIQDQNMVEPKVEDVEDSPPGSPFFHVESEESRESHDMEEESPESPDLQAESPESPDYNSSRPSYSAPTVSFSPASPSPSNRGSARYSRNSKRGVTWSSTVYEH